MQSKQLSCPVVWFRFLGFLVRAAGFAKMLATSRDGRKTCTCAVQKRVKKASSWKTSRNLSLLDECKCRNLIVIRLLDSVWLSSLLKKWSNFVDFLLFSFIFWVEAKCSTMMCWHYRTIKLLKFIRVASPSVELLKSGRDISHNVTIFELIWLQSEIVHVFRNWYGRYFGTDACRSVLSCCSFIY